MNVDSILNNLVFPISFNNKTFSKVEFEMFLKIAEQKGVKLNFILNSIKKQNKEVCI